MENFTEIFQEFLDTSGSTGAAKLESEKIYNDKYLGNGVTYIKTLPNSLISGAFYTFYYNAEIDPVKLAQSETKYIDKRPIILSLGKDPAGNEIGLNFNVIPYKLKLKLLTIYWKYMYKGYISRNIGEDLPKWKIIQINKKTISSLFNINLGVAISTFEQKKMVKLKVIEWEDIKILPLLYTKSIVTYKNSGISSIYERIIKNL